MADQVQVDLCRREVAGISYTGCIEACYPGKQYENLHTFTDQWMQPDDEMVRQAAEAGATILAYGGDGMWFAMRRRIEHEETELAQVHI